VIGRERPRHGRRTRIGVWMVGAACLVGAAGCVEIDREPGFAVSLESASVVITDEGASAVVSVEVGVMVRVGTYALSGRDFQITRADVFVGTQVVATVNLGAPEGGEMTLLPGESHTLTLSGESRPGAFPEAEMALCGAADISAEVLIQYEATMFEEGPLGVPHQEMGILMSPMSEVRCTTAGA